MNEGTSRAGAASASQRLLDDRDAIQRLWLSRVRAEVPAAHDQPELILLDNFPKVLVALASALDPASQDPTDTLDLFGEHAEKRVAWSSYSSEQLVREYALLRNVIFEVLDRSGVLSSTERNIILEFIDDGLEVTTNRFTELKRFHDDLERDYLRVLEQLVDESVHEGTLQESLERLLTVVNDGLHADAAAVVLSHEDTLDVALTSAAAGSPELARLYRGALALTGMSAPSSRTGAAPRVVDVARLRPDERQELDALGIEWVVVIAIRARAGFVGTLCIAFGHKRDFDPVEIHLAEVLANRLSLLLSNLRLHEESRGALARACRENIRIEAERSKLEDERRHHRDVLATISHDLKNPLSTAKMGAELLRLVPARAESIAGQILRSLDRSDRMINDLLDTHVVRAGKRLPLELAEYDMRELVASVIEDMRLLHGDRFVVRTDEECRGIWSWEDMRRVIENLLSNAVKYGKLESPITIVAGERDGRMQLSVHNEGPPISAEEKERIFEPFERGAASSRGRKGWGIGLTLVRGIIDAHGGNISVESDHGGTTFTIRNPMDSSPFQKGEGAEEAVAPSVP